MTAKTGGYAANGGEAMRMCGVKFNVASIYSRTWARHVGTTRALLAIRQAFAGTDEYKYKIPL